MPAVTPPKQPSDTLTCWLVLLILAAAFGAYMLPVHPADAVTFTQGPTAAPAQLPETPTPQPAAVTAPLSHAMPTAASGADLAFDSHSISGQPATPADLTTVTYVLNTNTRRFHLPDCTSVGEMKGKNRQDFTGTREDLIGQGYIPCGRCKP